MLDEEKQDGDADNISKQYFEGSYSVSNPIKTRSI